jgi:type IX secretion system substrate protein
LNRYLNKIIMMTLKKHKTTFLFVCTAIFIISPFCSNSQAPTIQWQKTIGGDQHDVLLYQHQTNDGGFICGGHSRSNISGSKNENSKGEADYWIVKLGVWGNIQWQNTIGGSKNDLLSKIYQTSDGGYICGGTSNSKANGDKTQNSNGGYDYWIVKLNALGIIEWQKTIGGNMDDELLAIEETSDGGYVLGGFSESSISGDKTENSQGSNDYWVLKLDSVGVIQWQNTIGGSLEDRLYVTHQTSDGGYIVGGDSHSNISGDKSEDSYGTNDYWILKLDTIGNILWQKTFGGGSVEVLTAIQQTIDEGYICGGWSRSNISGNKTENSQGSTDFWILKIDTIGNIQWQNTIGGGSADNLRSLQQTTDGGYITGGHSFSSISGDKTEDSRGGDDYWIVKIDSIGSIEWQKTIGGSKMDWLYSVQETTDGGYMCGGTSLSDVTGDKNEHSIGGLDYWVIKLNPIITSINFDKNPSSIINVFPNPASNYFKIKFENSSTAIPLEFILKDIYGGIIEIRKLFDKHFVVFDSKKLATGLYIVYIMFDNGLSISRKITIINK